MRHCPCRPEIEENKSEPDKLKKMGFDKSRKSSGGYNKVACSQCQAMVINGTACHERGCPNQVRVR